MYLAHRNVHTFMEIYNIRISMPWLQISENEMSLSIQYSSATMMLQSQSIINKRQQHDHFDLGGRQHGNVETVLQQVATLLTYGDDDDDDNEEDTLSSSTGDIEKYLDAWCDCFCLVST